MMNIEHNKLQQMLKIQNSIEYVKIVFKLFLYDNGLYCHVE